jgi:uncharacterized protein
MAGARQQQNDAQPLSALVSHNPFGFRPPDDDMVAAIQFLSLTKRSDDRVVHLETAEFFTFRAGLILTHRAFFDSFDFVQQLLGRDLTDSFAASVRDAMGR